MRSIDWLTTISNRIRATRFQRARRKLTGNRFTRAARLVQSEGSHALTESQSNYRESLWHSFDVAPRLHRGSRRFQSQAWSTADFSRSTERLEDRTLLSAFNEAGTVLNLDINAAETVGIVSNGTTYTMTTTGTWTGADSANVTGTGTSTLTVTAAGLAAFDTINVTDSAAGAAVNFNDSGANSYGDSINVTLDDAAAGTINVDSSTFTAPITITGGAITVAGTLNNTGGAVTLTANSPVDINADVTATGDIEINAVDSGAAGDDITIANAVQVNSSAGNVTLNAGDNIVFEGATAQASAAGQLVLNLNFANADGTGGTATLAGILSDADLPAVNGHAATTDTIDVSATGGGVSLISFQVTGVTGFSSIENFIGDGTGTSSIAVGALANTFTTTGQDDWDVDTNGGGTDFTFTDFPDIAAGGGNDTFNIGHTVTGNLDGEANNDTFNLTNLGAGSVGTLIGSGGNDEINGRSSDDDFNLAATNTITDPNNGNATVVSSFSGIETLSGGDGVDRLFVTAANAFNLTFNGDNGADGIILTGDATDDEILSTPTNATDGTLGLNTNGVAGDEATINYTGLAPIDVVSFPSATLQGTAAADTIAFDDGTLFFAGDNAIRVTSANFEDHAFRSVTNLTVQSLAGDDTINLNASTGASALVSNVNIDGGNNSDTVNVNGAFNFGANDVVISAVSSVVDGMGTVTAGNFAATVSSAFGTSGDPIDTAVTNVEISSGTGGAFVNQTGNLNIGGASAGLTGISTTNGEIAVSSTGSITVSEAIASGSGNIALTTDTIAVNAGISGTGTVTLQPVTGSRTIGIGGGAGDFNLDDTELTNLADGFSSITIGDATNGTGAVDVDSSTFNDDVTIVGGALAVTGLVGNAVNKSLIARTGAITDGSGDTTRDVDNNGGTPLLTVSAVSGIDLDVEVSQINITNTSGTVDLQENDGFGISAASLGSSTTTITTTNLTISGNVTGSGDLTAKHNNAADTIGLGGAAGTILINDAGLAFIQPGFNSITFGETGATGTITVDTATFENDTTIAGGDIVDSAGTDLTVNNGKTVTVDGTVRPGASPGILSVIGNFAFADNSTYEVEIGGATPGTANNNHDQIDATGSVTIGTGVTLTPVDFNGFGATITGGETFEIINRTGGTGTFDGLAEGAQVSANFLGSGLAASISYVGDDGDDVVITVAPATTTDVTLVGNVLTITDAESDNTADDLTISFVQGGYTITDQSGALIDASTINGSTGSGTATVTVPLGSIDGINIQTLGGDDVIRVSSVQSSLAGGFTIAGGTDRDRATISGNIPTTGTGAVDITVTGDITVNSAASITTANGGITLSGNAAGTTTGNIVGVTIDGGTVSSNGSGEIQITGQGGTATSSHGVVLTGGATVSSITGSTLPTITINATGGSGASSAGMVINGASAITSVSGAIDITATGNSSGDSGLITTGGTIESTGSATITISGSAANGDGITFGNTAVGDATGTGTITLQSDKVVLSGTTLVDGGGALVIEPLTAATTIGLGGGTGTLNLDDTELGLLSEGFTSITFGNSTAGNIDIDTASFADSVTLLTNGEILDNSGTDLTVANGDTATGDGTVAPGQPATPGILSVDGNFAFAGNSTFEVEIGGTTPGTAAANHDQLDASGTVDIGSNVTLDLVNHNSFGSSLTIGDKFEIINRDGGTGTFLGLTEGAEIDNFLGQAGVTAEITYEGGDGDDVVLTVKGNEAQVAGGTLTLNSGGNQINTYTISLINGGNDIQIQDTTGTLTAGSGATLNGGNIVIPAANVTNGIVINGGDAADSLEVDFSGGDPTGGLGLTFNGNDPTTDPGDTLSFSNGSFTTTTYTYDNLNDGNVNIDGTVFNYNGLEPLTSTITAANVILNYSAAAETITVSDAGGGSTTVNSTSGEITTFVNPTTLLQINAGDTGVNTINLGALAANYPANIDINGGNGGDSVDLQGSITFAADRSLTIDAHRIDNIANTPVITTSGTGAISLIATQSLLLRPGAALNTVNGGITLQGNAAGTSTDTFSGVDLADADLTTTGTGAISLTGQSGTGDALYGVHLRLGSTVTSTLAAGGGGITINGTADSTNAQSHGVLIENTGTLIDSKSGAIQITGNGGPGAVSHGVVLLSDADITSSDAVGAATITINGTGGTGGSGAGLVINDAISTITSITGAISVTANGGPSGAGFATAGGTISSTGTAPITITADGDNADAFSLVDTTIGNAAGTGTITLTGDEFTLSEFVGTTVIDGSGDLIIQPQTAGTDIELGDVNGTLSLDDTELGFLSAGFSTITIGKADAGGFNIESATLPDTTADSVTLLTAGTIRDIAGTPDLILGAGDTATLNGTVAPGFINLGAPGDPGILGVTGNVSLPDNTTFEVQIGGTTPGDGNGFHDQLDASGSVTIGNNVTLSTAVFLDGGGTNNFVPMQGDEFEIINRTGGTGTFAGLAEGALVSTDFLGSGERAGITYTGGDGDDVVIRILPPDVNVNAGNLVVNNEAGDINTFIITLIDAGATIQIQDTTNPIFAGTGATQVNANTVTVPANIVTNSITFNGRAAADSLEVDRTGGDPTLGLGVTWNGGDPTAADGDILSFTNGNVTTTTVNYTDANSGNVNVDGVVHTFTELEDRAAASGITSTLVSQNVVLNYSTTAETISVADSGGTSTTVDSAASASTTFTNPTTLLTLNAGDTGVNTIDVGALGNPYAGSIDINGGDAGDTINLNGAITFAADRSLTVDGLTINAPNAASDITASGTGTVGLTATRNIVLSSGASITTVDGGITLLANNGGVAGTFDGIEVLGATITSTNGDISLTGRGGDSAGIDNAGVVVQDGGAIRSTGTGAGAGTIILNGTGGNGGRADGVAVFAGGSIVTSVDGNIEITGVSGNDNGVAVGTDGSISSTGTGANAATITIMGTTGTTGVAPGFSIFGTTALVTSVDGDIQITGTTTIGGGTAFQGGSVTSTGAGANAANITIIGTGAGGGASDGINLNSSAGPATGGVFSIDGDVTLTGTGTGGSVGINITNRTALPVQATGDGNVLLTGDGTGAGTGVSINSEIDSNTGTVTVRSVDDNIVFGATGVIDSTSGLITIDADTAAAASITMANGSSIDAGTGAIDIDADVTATLETLTSTVGDITVTAGDVTLNSTISSAGALTLEPINAATTIGLGGGAGAFSVDDTELANLSDGFSGITIGKADAGDVTIDTTTFQDPVSLLTAGTFHDATGTDIAAAANAVTLQGTVAPGSAATTAGILNVTGNFAFADNDTFDVEIGGTTPGELATNHDQLNVTGTVTIGNNVGLTTSVLGGFSAVGGDIFVIINNDAADAVSGTFNGLPEGTRIANAIGTRSAVISYVGGDGNDVILTADGFFVSIDANGNLILTDNAGTNDAVTIQADPGTMEYVITHTTELIGDQTPNGTGGGTMEVRVPFSDVTGTEIIANFDGGDDSLNVDYTLGSAFNKAITLNGGEAGETNGDQLFITGDDGTTVVSGVYTPSNTAESGQHVLTLSAAAGGGTETINFTQLELANQVSDIPTYELETGGSNDTLTVAADAVGAIQAATITGTTDGIAITPITFYDVTSFTIDTGANDTNAVPPGDGAGNDSVTVNSGLDDGTDLARSLTNFSIDTGAAGTGNTDSAITNAVIDLPGSVTINNAETVDLNADIEAGTSVTISNVGTEIDLAQDVDLTAENGDLNLNTNVTAIDLSGAAGTNNLVANGAANGNISVGPISDSGTPASLVIDGDNAVTSAGIDVQSTISILANQDDAGAETFTQNGDISTTNDTAAAVSITVNNGGGGTGNASLGAISAGTTSGPAGGRITVNANSGAITDGNAAANNLTAGNAILIGTAGVGTAADPIETTLSRLEAAGGTGGVFVTDANSLTIGGIDAGQVGVSSGTGNIDIRTSSGTLTVDENITSTGTGNILLKTTDTAGVGDDLTVNAGVTVSTNSGNIDIQAGDNLTLVATSHLDATNGTITLTGDSDDADAGVGSTLTVASELDSTGTSINGGNDDDNYDFFYPTGVTNSGTVTIADTGGTDNVMIHGTAADEELFLTTADPPTTPTTEQVTRGDAVSEPVIIPGDIEAVTLLGGEGNDIFHVQPSMLFPLTVDGDNPSFGDFGVPPGDQLDLDTFGNSFTIDGKTIFVANGTPDPYQGITFLDIETVPLTPASVGPDQSFDFNSTTGAGVTLAQTATQAGYIGVTADTIFTPGNFGWQFPMESFNTPISTGPASDLINDGHSFVPSSGASTNTFTATVANGWAMVTVAFGCNSGSIIDGMQIENADDNTILARDLSAGVGETDHVTFLVLVQDGTLDLRFRDPFQNSLGRRMISLKGIDIETDGGTGDFGFLSMGFPTPGILAADGTTVDTFPLSAAVPNSLVTVETSLGTVTGTDADPNIEGFQVLTNGAGQADILIQRPSGAGQALVTLTSVTGRKTGCVVIDYGQVAGRNFDFNTPISATFSPFEATTNPDGYIGVNHNDVFTTDRGYGWTTALTQTFQLAPSVGGAMPDLVDDGHLGSDPQTFRTILDNGTYQVHVTMGNAGDHESVSVTANGNPVIDSQKIDERTFFETIFTVNVTSGQLDLTFSQNDGVFGDPNWIINALEIRPTASVVAITPPANIGDVEANGTNSNTLNFATTAPDGSLMTISSTLGTITTADADPNTVGIQVAVAGGQVSFDLQAGHKAGVPTFEIHSLDGEHRATVTDAAFLNYVVPVTRRLDFNFGPSDAATPPTTAAGFTSVTNDLQSPETFGFGANENRLVSFTQTGDIAGVTNDDFYRDGLRLELDGERAPKFTTATFSIEAKPATDYDVRVYLGSPPGLDYANFDVTVEGAGTQTVGTLAEGTFTSLVFSEADDTNGDGFITLTFFDNVAPFDGFGIPGIDIAETATGLPVIAPLLAAEFAAGNPVVSDNPTTINNSNLTAIVEVATIAFLNTDLSANQRATLQNISVSVADLDPGVLGLSDGAVITIDDDGAGAGWSRSLTEVAANQYDLLTVVGHEIGHALGYDHSDLVTDFQDLMNEALTVGVRFNSFGNVDDFFDAAIFDVTGIGDAPADPVSSGNAITVSLNDAGELLIADTSDNGLNQTLTLSTADGVLTISDPGNSFIADAGTLTSVHQVQVPISEITSLQVIVDLEAGADILNASGVGAGLALNISGGAGNDMITGGQGDDTVDGGAGNDDLAGGGGTDTLLVNGDSNITLTGSQSLGAGTDAIDDFEQAVLSGGAGNDRLDASQADMPVTFFGNDGDDTLLGSNFDDVFDGGAGHDVAEFVGSNITLTATSVMGSGNDSLASVEGLQLVAESLDSTIDASAYTAGSVTIVGSAGDDTLTGSPGDDVIIAGSGHDDVSGGEGNDVVIGGSGNDNLSGGAGEDTITGGHGRDLIDGGTDNDELRGGPQADTLRGGGGNDHLSGDAGRDSLEGEAGNDSLQGGTGANSLVGGEGEDVLNNIAVADDFNAPVGIDLLIGGNALQARPASANPPALIPSFTDAPAVASFATPPTNDTADSNDGKKVDPSTLDEAFGGSLIVELLEL